MLTVRLNNRVGSELQVERLHVPLAAAALVWRRHRGPTDREVNLHVVSSLVEIGIEGPSDRHPRGFFDASTGRDIYLAARQIWPNGYNPDSRDVRTDLLYTVAHEAHHLVQYARGDDLPEPEQARQEYDTDPLYERQARREGLAVVAGRYSELQGQVWQEVGDHTWFFPLETPYERLWQEWEELSYPIMRLVAPDELPG